MNSGAVPLFKKWNDIKDFVTKIVKSDKISKVGFMDLYEENAESGYSQGSNYGGWINFIFMGTPTDDTYRITRSIDVELVPEKYNCDVYEEYKFASEYFDLFRNFDDIIYKTTIMVSGNKINKNTYGKFFDKAKSSGVRMFLLYVGNETLSDEKNRKCRLNVVDRSNVDSLLDM